MSFAERLRQLIDESGKSLSQVAIGMGVTRRAIEYLINGRSNPRVTADFLLWRTDSRNITAISRERGI